MLVLTCLDSGSYRPVVGSTCCIYIYIIYMYIFIYNIPIYIYT